MQYTLNSKQIDKFSNFLIDLAKILIASIVIAYFLPQTDNKITTELLFGGIFTAILSLSLGLNLLE